jgi:hypothetical protein
MRRDTIDLVRVRLAAPGDEGHCFDAYPECIRSPGRSSQVAPWWAPLLLGAGDWNLKGSTVVPKQMMATWSQRLCQQP